MPIAKPPPEIASPVAPPRVDEAALWAQRQRPAAQYTEDLPEMAAVGRTRDPYPAHPANSPFWLVYDASRWDVMEGHLVPLLHRLSATPGANGVLRIGQGVNARAEPSEAFAAAERRGQIVIPWTVDAQPYLRGYKVGEGTDRKTGAVVQMYHWVTRWETLYNGSDAVTSDTAGYVSWLVSLLQRGVLPGPRPYVLERLRGDYQRRVAAARPDSPGRADMLARLAVVDAALAAAGGLSPADPTSADPGAAVAT